MQPQFRTFLAILLAASPAAGAAAATSHAAPASAPALAKRPNIIFILCDDLGYGDVGVFYQNQRAAMKDRSVPFFATPQIDTLARDGVKMTRHYSGAPVCAPSRASLLTGLTQGHANVRDNQFDKALADTHTLGTTLQQAGYATAAFGKWGLQGSAKAGGTEDDAAGSAALWPAYPTKRGFGYFFGYVRHRDGHFHYPKEDQREVWENDREISQDLNLCYTTDLFTARAKKWITDQAAAHPKQPFFVYLAYDTPHAKLQNPPCAYPPGGGLKGGVQWTGKPGGMLNTATGTMDGWMHPDYAKATWDHDHNATTPEVAWPDVQKRHANDVRRIDDAVGDVRQLLQDLKIADNTLVVFTSDNGPSAESYLKENYQPNFFRGFGPFDGIKRDTLDGGVREPTLACWPGVIPAGRVNDRPSGQWDWLATFAEQAGVPVPAASDGVSLMPSLTGQGRQLPGTVYVEYHVGGRTPNYPEFSRENRGRERKQMQNIDLDGYKGLRYNVQSADDDFEIYDLAKDPQETHNLAENPQFAHLQAAMKARVLQVRKPDPSAPRPYDNALVPPVTKEPAGSPGLAWSLFKGEWPWMPDFRTLTPASKGETNRIDLSMASANQPSGIAFEGFFHAEQDGEYTFTIDSDTGAMLFLHEIRVLDEPLKKPAGKSSGRVRLKAGWHPLRLYYRHAGGGQPKLDFEVRNPAGASLKPDESSFRSTAPPN
ncbi:MAG: sulfatase-like hydrolase/transferase [Akkermansiaceae bacterium]|nr:sulfatase-like hydrolase/transferase [Akkermansiaceae bacterium]